MGTARRRLQHRVKDQGDRPTCVAFAVSSLHEYWRDTASNGHESVTIDLSEEFLYYGCKEQDGLKGTAGTTIVAASNWLKRKGQCLEVLHPYHSNGVGGKPSPKAFQDALSRKLETLAPQPLTLDQLKRHLQREAPVAGVLELFDNVYRVDGRGLLNLPTVTHKRIGLHAVLLLEIEQGSSQEEIVFLNSWGPAWGDRGFGRFGVDYFAKHCKQLWAIREGQT